MDLSLLDTTLSDQPKFRLQQAKEAVFKNFIESWDEAKNIPKDVREILKKSCPLDIDAKLFFSKDDSTVKALITLKDRLKIETVLMRHEKYNSICVSCQVGCPMGCTFCATGKMGFTRNLTTNEILEQIILFGRLLKKENTKIDNITYMGMGEPFMNYENVLESIRTLNDKKLLNFGSRRISISTCGVIEGIGRLATENLEVNLAISLHAPNDKLRTEIMPSNRRYPLQKILQAVDNYISKTNRKVMFEYVLLKGVNDTASHALELSKLMKKKLYMVNLILYNPTGVYTATDFTEVKNFKQILEDKGVNVTQRYRFGQDIDAACGQLATRQDRIKS